MSCWTLYVPLAFMSDASKADRVVQDEGRLPDGMERVGYDADTEVYTYQDEQGNYWQGEPGTRYGQLQRTGTRGAVNRNPVLWKYVHLLDMLPTSL